MTNLVRPESMVREALAVQVKDIVILAALVILVIFLMISSVVQQELISAALTRQHQLVVKT